MLRRVDRDMIIRSFAGFYILHPTKLHTDLCELVGITPEQNEEWTESWTLWVSSATYKKLLVLADEGKRRHYSTLFRVIDARLSKETPHE